MPIIVLYNSPNFLLRSSSPSTSFSWIERGKDNNIVIQKMRFFKMYILRYKLHNMFRKLPAFLDQFVNFNLIWALSSPKYKYITHYFHASWMKESDGLFDYNLSLIIIVYYSLGFKESALKFWREISKIVVGALLIRRKISMLVS